MTNDEQRSEQQHETSGSTSSRIFSHSRPEHLGGACVPVCTMIPSEDDRDSESITLAIADLEDRQAINGLAPRPTLLLYSASVRFGLCAAAIACPEPAGELRVAADFSTRSRSAEFHRLREKSQSSNRLLKSQVDKALAHLRDGGNRKSAIAERPTVKEQERCPCCLRPFYVLGVRTRPAAHCALCGRCCCASDCVPKALLDLGPGEDGGTVEMRVRACERCLACVARSRWQRLRLRAQRSSRADPLIRLFSAVFRETRILIALLDQVAALRASVRFVLGLDKNHPRPLESETRLMGALKRGLGRLVRRATGKPSNAGEARAAAVCDAATFNSVSVKFKARQLRGAIAHCCSEFRVRLPAEADLQAQGEGAAVDLTPARSEALANLRSLLALFWNRRFLPLTHRANRELDVILELMCPQQQHLQHLVKPPSIQAPLRRHLEANQPLSRSASAALCDDAPAEDDSHKRGASSFQSRLKHLGAVSSPAILYNASSFVGNTDGVGTACSEPDSRPLRDAKGATALPRDLRDVMPLLGDRRRTAIEALGNAYCQVARLLFENMLVVQSGRVSGFCRGFAKRCAPAFIQAFNGIQGLLTLELAGARLDHEKRLCELKVFVQGWHRHSAPILAAHLDPDRIEMPGSNDDVVEFSGADCMLACLKHANRRIVAAGGEARMDIEEAAALGLLVEVISACSSPPTNTEFDGILDPAAFGPGSRAHSGSRVGLQSCGSAKVAGSSSGWLGSICKTEQCSRALLRANCEVVALFWDDLDTRFRGEVDGACFVDTPSVAQGRSVLSDLHRTLCSVAPV